jgi:hypothetical protein
MDSDQGSMGARSHEMFTYPSLEGQARSVARSCDMQAVSILYLQTTYILLVSGLVNGTHRLQYT